LDNERLGREKRGVKMRVEADELTGGRASTVVVCSERLAARVALAGGSLLITLGTSKGDWVLTRPGNTDEPASAASTGSGPLRWELDVVEGADSAYVTAVGRSEELVQSICLLVRGAGNWLEVTETLSSTGRALPALEAFESRWRLSGGGEVREVFTPSLVPEEGDLVGQHMFRAPVLVAESGEMGVALVVDIEELGKAVSIPAALNLLRVAEGNVELIVGLHAQQVRGHVFHTRRAPTSDAVAGTISHRYFLGLFPNPGPGATLAAARKKIWAVGQADRAGRQLEQGGEEFARQIYPGALERLWAETVLAGRRVGAITANRSYARDVWFSCWFNPLRSSYGLYHYGVVLGKDDWVAMARATRALALSAPGSGGFFPTVFVFGDNRWVGSHHQGGGPGIFHLMDMSWTMYQLLQWHRDLEADEESIARALAYAKALAGAQRTDGGLPAYIDREGAPVTRVDHSALLRDLRGGEGDPYVPEMLEGRWSEARFVESAEDSASLLFLATLAGLLPSRDEALGDVLGTARGIARYLAERVVPSARWTDFEVYFSCSPKDLDFYDHRSGQWPQNTLCMHHAAAGLLALHEVTGEMEYLELAVRVMDRLCLYQQVWGPPWLGLSAYGGYGVMNTDGEWNDARQAQFAETHLAFGRATGEQEHIERAVAAARAAFTTTFSPAAASRYSGWWRSPQGMAAENHGHGGRDELNGVSGFDWGTGSALATAAYFERQRVPL
jgi:hypothetical protein